MTTHVIYHGHCYDGFTSAWAAYRALGNDAKYIPAAYGDAPPEPEPPPQAGIRMARMVAMMLRPIFETFIQPLKIVSPLICSSDCLTTGERSTE